MLVLNSSPIFSEHQDDGCADSSLKDNVPSKLAALEEIEGDVDGYKCGIQGCGAILKTTLELVRTDDTTATWIVLCFFLTLCPNSNPNRTDPITTGTGLLPKFYYQFSSNSMWNVPPLLLGCSPRIFPST